MRWLRPQRWQKPTRCTPRKHLGPWERTSIDSIDRCLGCGVVVPQEHV